MKINREKLDKEAEGKGIKFIIFFGSHVLRKAHKDSDYDVAVLTVQKKNISKSLDHYSDILSFISEALGIPDYKLDLTNLNNANPLLRYEVAARGELIYGDRDAYDEYRAFAFKEYIDAKPLFKLEELIIRRRQELFKEALS